MSAGVRKIDALIRNEWSVFDRFQLGEKQAVFISGSTGLYRTSPSITPSLHRYLHSLVRSLVLFIFLHSFSNIGTIRSDSDSSSDEDKDLEVDSGPEDTNLDVVFTETTMDVDNGNIFGA